jgi:hypothetical protein
MRFCKETRALIHKAAPHSTTIPWPQGEREPKVGRIYWLQSKEDAEEAEKKEKARRERSPDTHAEVMAGMRRRRLGEEAVVAAQVKKGKHQPLAPRPQAGDHRVMVVDRAILDKGWEATVVLYEDPDPVNHAGIKAKVPAGPNPLDGVHEQTETEPEQIAETPFQKHRRRLEEQDSLKLEHTASVDRAAVMKAEQKLINQRRRGKRSILAEQAVARARKRTELVTADAPV